MQILQMYFSVDRWQKYFPTVVRQHDNIIEALASNRAQDAQVFMEEHIQTTMVRLICAIHAPMRAQEEVKTLTTN